MKAFNVYRGPAGQVEVIKSGWSWPAFFFAWIWAFSKGLIGTGLVLIGVNLFALVLTARTRSDLLFYFMMLLVALWFGAAGNEMRETKVIKRGYRASGQVHASDVDQALSHAVEEIRMAAEREHAKKAAPITDSA